MHQNKKIKIHNYSSFILSSFFYILHSTFCIATAQTTTSSPYSRYGIGDMQGNGLLQNMSMGGISQSINNPYNINIVNPASYSSLQLTTFETAIHSNFTVLSTSALSDTINSSSFGYLALAFPVSKKWGASFGLLPYSRVGYKISDEETRNDIGKIKYLYEGTGGVNQFYVGAAYKIYKNLSLGMNASYLFGSINKTRTVEIPDTSNIFFTRIKNNITVDDFYFNYGLQYTFDSLKIFASDSLKTVRYAIQSVDDSLEVIEQLLRKMTDSMKIADKTLSLKSDSLKQRRRNLKDLKKSIKGKCAKSDWSMTCGIIGNLSSNVRIANDTVINRYLNTSTSSVVVIDTIQNNVNTKGELILPASFGIGVTFKKNTKWLLGIDYTMQNWSNYKMGIQTDGLVNSWKIATGVQYVPKADALNSYFKQVQYRMGLYYSKTNLELKGMQLDDYGFSVGLGLPVRRALTTIQLSAILGQRGTQNNGLLREQYARFSVGFTLNDKWFTKRKYD